MMVSDSSVVSVSCWLSGRGRMQSLWSRVAASESLAEQRVVGGREGGEIQDRIVMRADWSRKVRIGGALLPCSVIGLT